jgi:hypothetical protein
MDLVPTTPDNYDDHTKTFMTNTPSQTETYQAITLASWTPPAAIYWMNLELQFYGIPWIYFLI